MNYDWESDVTEVFLNPRMEKRKELEQKLLSLEGFPGHIWLASSGSRRRKFIALSKRALLVSAEGINRHIGATKKDIWLNPLPLFHVGGLGIWARAFLSGATVASFPGKWDPERYYQTLCATQATLTSLVPTQVYDLIARKFCAPAQLRVALVGGGYLSDALYKHAHALGWPLAPSYGLTECASQVATAKLGDRKLHILDHVSVMINEAGRICLRSQALFSAIVFDNFIPENPKENGWYTTSDLGTMDGAFLTVNGRDDDAIKISGELVSLSALERKLDTILHQYILGNGFALRIMEDDRLGNRVELVAERHYSSTQVEEICHAFNNQVMPYERIREVIYVEQIPQKLVARD